MINSETKIIGLFGHPVTHSKSPQMHNTMFKHLGLNYIYLTFDIHENQLEAGVKGIKALQIKGINITIPHKVNIIPFLDEISPEAEAIGAVNTIVNQDGKLIGYNTDGEGYVRSLVEETGIDLKGRSVMILGAGGAARAIGYTLANHNLGEIVLVNRDLAKANELKKIIKNVSITVINYDNLTSYVDKADIIINTTSIGMHPNINQSMIEKDWLHSKQIVSDIIYNPLKTRLIRDAQEKDATVHTGLGMFVYQGAIAFEKWIGIAPDVEVMRRAVLETFLAKN